MVPIPPKLPPLQGSSNAEHETDLAWVRIHHYTRRSDKRIGRMAFGNGAPHMTHVTRMGTIWCAGLLVALSACASGSGGASGGGAMFDQTRQMAKSERDDPNFITREEIAKSQARNGWEALRWNARHLVLTEQRGVLDGRVGVQHRGPDSLFTNDNLVLIIDGILTTEMARLRQMPASMIESIQILSARNAVLLYGSDAGGGAIVVKTSSGRR